MPCFKCIVRSGYEQQIYATIQDNLFAIAEDDIDALDAEDDTGADISILDPDSRFAPWSEYTRAGSEAYEWADGDVFPEPIVESSYKTVWRGLQQRTNIRFEQLLDRCHKLLGYLAASPTPEQFENSTECQICYNSHQNILYIGSDKNKEDIEQIVEKLNALVDIQVRRDRSTLTGSAVYVYSSLLTFARRPALDLSSITSFWTARTVHTLPTNGLLTSGSIVQPICLIILGALRTAAVS